MKDAPDRRHGSTCRLVRPKGDFVRHFFDLTEVAEICGLSTTEVLKWIDANALPATRVAPGRWRIPAGDLMAFLQRTDITSWIAEERREKER